MVNYDSDDMPPLSQQTRRPLDTALRQQRVKAWYPVLDPWWVIGSFIVLGAIFVPIGKFSGGGGARRGELGQRGHVYIDITELILTHADTFSLFLYICIGFYIQSLSNQIFERVVQYDAYDSPHPECGINTTVNAGTNCQISITVDEDLTPPILIYYQIENFHQNHRTYEKSRDNYQVLYEFWIAFCNFMVSRILYRAIAIDYI